MTTPTYQSKIKNIVNRKNEISEIERALLKSEGANALVIGEEGVGKKTIINAFAKKLYEGTGNSLLAYKRLLKLNMEKILSQLEDMKKREEFLETLFKEAAGAENIILVIENFDNYVSHVQDRIDLTTSIEKYARSSEVQIIGVTTTFNYNKYIFPNEKINRYFEKVNVFEIGIEEAEKILLQLSLEFEKKYNLNILYETIKNTLDKSSFYITSIPFPEKAIELLDNACVYTLEVLKNSVATPESVDKVLAEKTHTPTFISDGLKNKLVHLESLLHSKIINQDEAINELSKALRRSFILLGKRKKPLASFLLLGPTGVGKTETAKAINQVFFQNNSVGTEHCSVPTFNRLDMSFYQNKEDIPKLIGSSDINDPGILTSQVRSNPYGLLLLDEIEKANRDLINIFLTVLDEGYFVDGFGKRVDCKNLIIIATSNAGSDILFSLMNENAVGTGRDLSVQNTIINHLISQHVFSPEFLNRFDGVIVYNPLDQTALLEIAKRKIEEIANDILKLHKIKLQVNSKLVEEIIKKNHHPEFGARNLDRILRDEIEDKIAKLILENKVKEGEIIII